MAGAHGIDWEAFEDAIYDWVVGQLGASFSVAWAGQDTATRPYPYVLLEMLSGPTRLHEDREMPVAQEDGRVKFFSVGDRTVTLSIDVLANQEGSGYNPMTSGHAYASLLQGSLGRSDVLDALGESSIGVLQVGTVQNRRTTLDAGFISRAGFDLTIHLVSVIDPGSVDAVETVGVAGETESALDFEEKDFGLASLAVRFWGETHITTPAATVIAVADDWSKVAGTYTAGSLRDFESPESGRLRYVGTEPRVHKLSLAASGITSDAPTVAKIGFSVNGADPTHYLEVAVGSSKASGYVEDVLELATDDEVEAWLTTEDAASVTVNRLSIVAIA